MNIELKKLIQHVVDENLQAAKGCVKKILEKDTSVSNQNFCKTILEKLASSKSVFIESLPCDLKSIINVENVSETFYENRYYLAERDLVVFDHIITTNAVNEKLAEMRIRHLNTTLLFGESGVGKTTFGKYVAYKLGLPFVYLNFAHCLSSYLGSTSKNIDKVFKYIKQKKCVLMIDELDAIGLMRGREDVGEMSRIVIGLMQALDLLENDTIVIGATNRVDLIDAAIIRRFSLKHEVKHLNETETTQFIKMYLDDLKVQYNEENIRNYAKNQRKQSEVVNAITTGVIEMLSHGEPFLLTG